MPLKATSTNRLRAAVLACALALGAGSAAAAPALVVDVDSGQTLFQRDATEPWFPASLTKLMTTYVALQAVRDGRLTLDTPLTMSARAANMPASKMGFRPGVEVTLDNALKMLMVKSPNDVAVMIAESVSGSVEDFADEMNATGRRLGLKESHFVNPNGLHNPAHVSSARDMAIIARALLKDFPDHGDLYGIGALQLGDEIIQNHNGLLGRYPGADGMKTGFTCPAGFNVVGSATQGGRRLIVVVLGSPSARERTIEAAHLLDQGFARWGGGEGALADLPASDTLTAPDMRPRNLLATQPRRDRRRRGGRRAADGDARVGPQRSGDRPRRSEPDHHRSDGRRARSLRSGSDFHRPEAGLDRPGPGRAPARERVRAARQRLRRRQARGRRGPGRRKRAEGAAKRAAPGPTAQERRVRPSCEARQDTQGRRARQDDGPRQGRQRGEKEGRGRARRAGPLARPPPGVTKA